MSAPISCGLNDFDAPLVLRTSRGKSAAFSCRFNDLPGLLILRGPEQDSTEMTEKVGPHDAELVLRDIPRQLGEWRREPQRRDARLGPFGVQAAALQAVRDEVIGITTTPRGLRPCAPSDLTGRCRTCALATADAAVRHKPSATDAAGPLREHPQMLASTAARQVGPLLASNPGSILASAEAYPHLGDIAIDGTALATAGAVTVGCGLLIGLASIIVLRGTLSGHRVGVRTASDRRAAWVRSGLVATQLALSVIVLGR
jgi:hypothetical protein